MKLITRYDGIGHFELDEAERKVMLDIVDVTSERKNDALRCRNYKGQFDSQRAIYVKSMDSLFPDFPMILETVDTYNVAASSIQSEVAWYNNQAVIGWRRLGSCIPVVRDSQNNHVNLEILFPRDHPCSEGHYLMFLNLAPGYRPDVVDDLASKLAALEGLTTAMPLFYGRREKQREPLGYSIADVHRLNRVFESYATAAKRIDKLGNEEPKITKKELNTLRHDSVAHENIVVRRDSAKLYGEILEQLIKI